MGKKKIIVACGGTGGHTFPGLAVAQELARRGHDVVVWASGRAIEGSVMKSWEGPVFSTGAKPLSLRNAFANLFISQIHSFVVGFQGMAEQPTNKTVMLQGTWGLEVTHAGDMSDEVFYLISTSGTEQ